VPAWAAVVAVLAIGMLAAPAWVRARNAQSRGAPGESLVCCYVAYTAALCLAALVVFPFIDRGQDLGALARHIRADTARQPLALLAPDETTVAIIDHGFTGSFTVLSAGNAGAVRGWFAARGARARILVLLPGHAPGALTQWLGRWYPASPPGDGIATELIASGAAALVQRYELPQGRRYALLGPPQDFKP
jgi:hypothetical protein